MTRLERHYRDMCDIEFTVERGKLWMLQTRVGKRTPEAAFRIAVHMVDEGLIDMDEALRRVTGEQLAQLMFPRFDESAEPHAARHGHERLPGRRRRQGGLRLRHRRGVGRARRGRDPGPQGDQPRRPARHDRRPGILTSRGGKTSHAAVVARGMGRTCVCGAEALDVDTKARRVHASATARRSARATSSPSTAPPARSSPARCRSSDSVVVRHFEGEKIDDDLVAGGRADHGPRRRRPPAARPQPTPTPPRTPPGPAASAPRASGCAAPSTCSSASGASSSRSSSSPRTRQAQRPRSTSCCRCSGRTSRDLRGDGRAAGDDPAARPAAARVPARPHRAAASRSPSPRSAASPTSTRRELLTHVQRLHEQNPMLGPARRAARASRSPACSACRRARSLEAAAERIGRRRHAAPGDHGAAGRERAGARRSSGPRSTSRSPRRSRRSAASSSTSRSAR